MKKGLLLLLSIVFFSVLTQAQTTVVFWDFNSNPGDANSGTGITTPAIGTGTVSLIGGVTSPSFNAGSPNDPNTADNAGWQTTSYPTISASPKTAGIQIAVSTVGYSNIVLDFDQRLSNTAANTWVLQYTSDISIPTPIWTDAQTFTFTPAPSGTGDTWYSRSYDFSAITALNNNPNAGFRVVSDFGNATQYLAARSTSTYSGTGTSRFDLIKVSSLPSVIPYTLAFVAADQTVMESAGTATVALKVTSVGNTAGTIDLAISNYTNANNPADYSIINTTISVPVTLALNDVISFTVDIVEDNLPESEEYVICKLTNGVDVNFAGSAQHTLYIKDNDRTTPQASDQLSLNLLASFSNGTAGVNSAEICEYDPISQRLFIANSIGSKLDIVNFADPSNPVLFSSIDITTYGAINSVAVKNGIVALAIENAPNKQLPGKVVFMDTNGTFISQVTVGVLPDMVAFNHAGTKVYTANEGEPNDSYTVDPEGSVSVVDISGGVASVTGANVTQISFTSFNGQEALLRSQGIRIFGPNATAAQDFEPEYITISDDDTKGWVTLQENNAIAELNLVNNTIVKLIPLGTKDHNVFGNGLDASDVTSQINNSNFPIKGMYLPDAVAQYSMGGNVYLLTANEGDARAYSGFNEESSVSALPLDPVIFPNAADIKNNAVLGRLKVTSASGDLNNNGTFEEIHVFGARSFSIWDAASGSQVFDSGNELEEITANHPLYGNLFNASNGAPIAKKNRSDDKGPEPEGIAIGKVNNIDYAFIALERIGGVMAYDITNPSAPQYVTYSNNRGPDRGSEGIVFISAADSPNGKNLLVLANETSSTLSIFEIEPCSIPAVSITANGPLSFCNGLSVDLSVAGSYDTYEWSNGSTENTIEASTSGLYTVTVTDSNGCSGQASVTVTVLPSPNITVSGATNYCQNGIINLIATGGNTYHWSGPNGYTATGNSISRQSANTTMSGTYTVTVSNNDCTATVNTVVTVNPNPTATLSGTSSICSGGTIALTAPAGATSYQWSGPNGFSANTGSTNTLNRTGATTTMAGLYKVTVTNAGGCTATASRSVSVNAPTTASITGATSVCGNANVILTATTAGVAYSWTGPGGYGLYTS